MDPGAETYCFRTGTFSEVFLLGVGDIFYVKNVSSERFSLARFWAKRVFSEKAPLSCFPSPGQVLPEPLLKPLFGHMLKPLCHTLSCNGFQCVAAWGYHPEHAQNRLCSIQWLVLCLVEASCSQGVNSKLKFETYRIFSERKWRYAH